LSASSASAARRAPADEINAVDACGEALRAAMPPMRLHSLSIHNNEGDVVWLSEGALGPDEHSLVYEAVEALREGDKAHFTRAVDDDHAALFLAVRSPRGELVGLVMAHADPASWKGKAPLQSINAAQRSALQKIAVMLRIKAGKSGATSSSTKLSLPNAAASGSEPELALASAPLPVLKAAPPETSGTVLMPKKVAEVLTLEDTIQGAARLAIPPTVAPAESHDPAADLILDIQQLTQLRSGGRTRRYEVLARSRRDAERKAVPPAFVGSEARGPQGAVLDAHVLRQLLGWLGENPTVWEAEPASFSLNLSLGALEDANFLQKLPADLERTGVAPQCIGFEVSELACTESSEHVARFIESCEKIGCFVVLDNFSLAQSALPFLRSSALRLVKIDTRLTANAMQDKLSQALVVAIAQVCKVLGIHCVAKSVESQAALQWLTGVGCDFGQGHILDRPVPLESLTAPAGVAKPSSKRRKAAR
jgi:EAL domain-containing protein (putative c-di-GMP-specific phosphodiesterase class I)